MNFELATQTYLITTNHFQFHLRDAASNPNYSRLWNDHNLPYMVAVAPGIMAVGTVRYGGPTLVDVEIVISKPALDLREWDQVLQCSVVFPSGVLRLEVPETGAADDASIVVAPGSYQAFVLYAELDSVEDNRALSGDDHYKIILWPAEKMKLTLVKKWRGRKG